MAESIVEELKRLESGVRMFDAKLMCEVLVLAPVMFIIGDNPMLSELCNHQGSTAKRFCRICMVSSFIQCHSTFNPLCIHLLQVDKAYCPDMVGPLRTREVYDNFCKKIKAEVINTRKRQISTEYGFQDVHNPLMNLHIDLYM